MTPHHSIHGGEQNKHKQHHRFVLHTKTMRRQNHDALISFSDDTTNTARDEPR